MRLEPLLGKVAPDDPFFHLIEEAYRVFAYPKPKSIEVCESCCMDAAIEADFFNPPIRQLPLSYVRDWYFAAYLPPGIAKETWGYLLPRILEILAAGQDLSHSIEVSLNRFQTGNPELWSAREWNVIDRFQRAFLKNKIQPSDEYLDDFVCMFGLAGWDVDGLMRQVSSASDEDLARRFWNDWCRNVVPGREDIWITAFWEGEGRSTAYNFYTSQDLHDRMQALALDRTTEPELAEKAFAVASVIEASGE
jgi:hypothetical protein